VGAVHHPRPRGAGGADHARLRLPRGPRRRERRHRAAAVPPRARVHADARGGPAAGRRLGRVGGPGMSAALQVQDAHVVYRSRGRGEVHAVDGGWLALDRGEIVGLVGESGSGKSSLARAVVGLERLHAGSITLDGVPVQPVGWRTRTDTRSQMVFQSPYASLNPRRTGRSQLRDGPPPALPDPAAEVAALLERVGLPAEAAARYPHQFSGGQRQRIAIARAIAPRPEVLVADEPVTALDASAQAQVVALLGSLVRDLGVGMLFISHDLALVRHIADRVGVMYQGRLVEQGPTEQVWRERRHPYTRELIDAVPRLGAARRTKESA